MTTYYVRKSGSNSNAGTSAGSTFLTVDKAASTATSAGDVVWIGAGVYREEVTLDASGTTGNTIKFKADLDGSQTGDPGIVVISAFNASVGAVARSSCLLCNSRQFFEFQDVIFYGGSGETVIGGGGATANPFEEVTFRRCTFIRTNTTTAVVSFYFYRGGTPTNAGITFDKCVFLNGGLSLTYDNHPTTAQNFKSLIQNCVFLGNKLSSFDIMVLFRLLSDSTQKSGGVKVYNCYISGATVGVTGFDAQSTTYTMDVRNCLITNCTYGIERFNGTSGAVTSDYNYFTGNLTNNYTNVSAGSNDKTAGEFLLLGGFADLPFYSLWGWSPYKPWEPLSGSGLIDAASASFAPADDLYGNPRPMGRNVDDIGPVEARTRPAKKTSSPIAGSISAQFSGQGYQDFIGIPVSAVSTTVTCEAKYDSNYTGTLPQLIVYSSAGASLGSDTMTNGANTQETLSVNFTPSVAGVVRVRLQSNDTSSNGTCHFDTLAVS